MTSTDGAGRLYTDIDPFCCAVLRARVEDGGLPPGEVWERDIKTLTAEELEPFTQIHLFAGIGASPLGLWWAGWPADRSIITGGFPCQQVSSAGKGEGLGTEENPTDRSGLFWEAVRIVRIKRPDGVLVENVGALSARGLDRVVGALGSLGYDVHALCLGAWATGSPQRRQRWWIVALANSDGHGRDAVVRHADDEHERSTPEAHTSCRGGEGELAGIVRGGQQQGKSDLHAGQHDADRGREAGELADLCSGGQGAVGEGEARPESDERGSGCGEGRVALGDSTGAGLEGQRYHAGQPQEPESRYANPRRYPHPLWVDEDGNPVPTPQYEWEPPRLYSRGMAGLADGIPDRLASALNRCGVAATGNAQVPQCVEVIARAMMVCLPKGRCADSGERSVR